MTKLIPKRQLGGLMKLLVRNLAKNAPKTVTKVPGKSTTIPLVMGSKFPVFYSGVIKKGSGEVVTPMGSYSFPGYSRYGDSILKKGNFVYDANGNIKFQEELTHNGFGSLYWAPQRPTMNPVQTVGYRYGFGGLNARDVDYANRLAIADNDGILKELLLTSGDEIKNNYGHWFDAADIKARSQGTTDFIIRRVKSGILTPSEGADIIRDQAVKDISDLKQISPKGSLEWDQFVGQPEEWGMRFFGDAMDQIQLPHGQTQENAIGQALINMANRK